MLVCFKVIIIVTDYSVVIDTLLFDSIRCHVISLFYVQILALNAVVIDD